MRAFVGEHRLVLDEQGRVLLPKTFVKVLEQEDDEFDPKEHTSRIRIFCVATDGKPYLDFFSAAAFEEVAQKISALPRGSKERAILERIILGQTLELRIDRNRKLTIPMGVRYKKDLGKKGDFESQIVVLLGYGDSFQLWKEADLEKHHEGLFDSIGDMGNFDPLALLDESKTP